MPVDEATQSEFAAGSPQAIRTVYAAYNKQVLTVTMSMLGNRALAKEAVQQTFLNAWRRAGPYDPIPGTLTLLHRPEGLGRRLSQGASPPQGECRPRYGR